MQWMGKHLNWTYGIALIIALIAVLVYILTSTSISYIGWIVYIAIIWIGGSIVEWRKDNWITSKSPLLILIPPVFAIVILCAHNNRHDKAKLTESTENKRGDNA